ncbi:MAG: zinc ribbon domain-containing protein [Bacteroidetes bacterium]|nr:zinc ribbon domain-containing protein [Rhodothermia bacterium]MCS7154465.1 zinc ribbon domain-containing protein [Bacteroidota bacterium]MCX7906838.1 zinc ribbon domain-containing protein [Bacteroidota bacterium]MDW8136883.1 zinc ribbon domain-containing protein [Bacteroidota bacterium]MDW8285247.1 zinc ribbon domain-containing protein [Bacteroidota bacterium]
MPIYEYRCQACQRRFAIFVRRITEEVHPACPQCGAQDVRRLISRVAIVHSEEAHLDKLADPGALGDVDENDPRSVARWMRRMEGMLGEDLGEEFHEMLDRLEAGEDPETIEREFSEREGGSEKESSSGDYEYF